MAGAAVGVEVEADLVGAEAILLVMAQLLQMQTSFAGELCGDVCGWNSFKWIHDL